MRTRLKLAARVLAVVMAIGIAFLSLTPDTDDIESATDIFTWMMGLIGHPDAGDKLAHFAAYGGIAAASALGFARTWRRFLAVFGTLVFYGLALEVLQGMGGVRVTDAGDLLANTLGVLTGLAAGGIALSLYRKWFPAP